MLDKIKNQNAFSILEVLIAIAIMAVGMLGISSLMIQSLQVENIDRDYLISSMLAQEGLELVRNQRDLNWLTEGANWYDHIILDGDYIIDYYPSGSGGDAINIYDVDGVSFDLLIAQARMSVDAFGFYFHDQVGTPNSQFYRVIEVDDSNLGSGDGFLIITCTVRFERIGQTKDYVASSKLYPWRY